MFKTISESLQSSSIHGISNIFKTKFFILKLCWFILFLISLLACSYIIKRSIEDYLNFDVITVFKVKFENQLTFPVVSFCNLDLFSTNYARQAISNSTRSRTHDMPSNLKYWAKLISSFDNLSFNRTLLGLDLREFLFVCKFNQINCDLTNDFERYYDFNYGNCFRFNSGKNMFGKEMPRKNTFKPGFLNGLHLEFFVDDPMSNNNFLSEETGLILFITDKSSNSNINGIKLSGGFATSIILEKQTISQIPIPYSDCTENLNSIYSYKSECYKKLFQKSKTNIVYSFMDCYSMCFQKLLGIKCECQNAIAYFNEMRKCGLNESLFKIDDKCQTDSYFEFTNSSSHLESCDCPFECETTKLTYTTSFARFPSNSYALQLIRNNSFLRFKFSDKLANSNYSWKISYQDLSNSLISVDIYFDELKSTNIMNNVKFALVDLITNIGGALGLFLGVSFLSLIELIEIPITCLLILIFGTERKTYPID